MLICSSCGNENPDGFALCGFCAAALVPQSAPAALEERKVVTVLFCDLVGFTAASEQQDPEDVRARIRPYHTRLLSEIEHYGGPVAVIRPQTRMVEANHRGTSPRIGKRGLASKRTVANAGYPEVQPDGWGRAARRFLEDTNEGTPGEGFSRGGETCAGGSPTSGGAGG